MCWKRCGFNDSEEEGQGWWWYQLQWTPTAVGNGSGMAELKAGLAGGPRYLRPVSPALLPPGPLASNILLPLPPTSASAARQVSHAMLEPVQVTRCQQL
ncbi:hypothetical protein NDU88_005409 [Pleurodeles waltl]|uniref:Uncharacterized protein n=1 Tax=Pleurodeles waltl TaxID=8319 RepID=A0AAV7MEI6_PLEWA|nr:hypothetical protein NDU88_005409 [Pleurodeles waltl]